MAIDWNQLVTAERKETEARKALRARIAAARYEREVAGLMINGLMIDTERDSQALITGAALEATIDPEYVCRWKTSVGFVELSADVLINVARTVRRHVQACFDREAELLEALDDGSFTEAMLTEGWPNETVPEPADS